MQKYNIEQFLGGGAYGKVYRVCQKSTGKKYALKQLKYNKQFLMAKIPHFNRQLQTLEVLSHPNIVGWVETFEENNMISIVMDLCSQGDLSNYIKCGKGANLTDQQKLDLFGQILQGMNYIHSENFMHRDLKPENIFINENYVAKIGDFGMIKKYQNQAQKLKHTIAGTPLYASPQVLDQTGYYSKKCDVYSIGLILYFIVFNQQFFIEARDMAELKQLQQRTHQKPLAKLLQSLECPGIFKLFLSRTLCYNQNDRASMSQLRKLFIQKIRPRTSLPKLQEAVIQSLNSLFLKFYKQSSIFNDYTSILSQLNSNKKLNIKTIKRYVLIFLIACRLITGYEKMILSIKGQLIQDKQFNEARSQWIIKIQDKIEQYKSLCKRVSQLILQKRSHKFFVQNQQILQLVLNFQSTFTIPPSNSDYLDIIRYLVANQESSKKQITNSKKQFLLKLQQLI